MSNLTVSISKITNKDMLPSNMSSIDGLDLIQVRDLLDAELFSSDVSYLYGAGACVQEIKSFDAVSMFNDMKCFMYDYEGDMVVFYSNEIKLKFGSDDLAMDYLQYLQADYIKMVARLLCDDMVSSSLKTYEYSKFDTMTKKYTEYEKNLLKKFIDEDSHSKNIWEDSIKSSRVLEHKGCVYIIEDSKERLVKIGRSEKPEQRVDTIRTTSGRVVRRVFISSQFYGYQKAEILAHKELADSRRVGEWFSCDFDSAKKVVDSVVSSFGQPDETDVFISDLIQRYNLDLALHKMGSFISGTNIHQ